MLTIVMLMGGKASRMNYPVPSKPFQMVGGEMMVQRTINNLPPADHYVLLVRQDEAFLAQQVFVGEDVTIIGEDSPRGIVEAALKGVNAAAPGMVMIAHADQWLDWSSDHFGSYARRKDRIVLPVAMHHTSNAGAVAINGVHQEVNAIIPKVSSELFGLCGIYWFPSTGIARDALEGMGELDLVLGQHYVENGIRKLIRRGVPVDYYPVRRVWLMDTREQLDEMERVQPWKT